MPMTIVMGERSSAEYPDVTPVIKVQAEKPLSNVRRLIMEWSIPWRSSGLRHQAAGLHQFGESLALFHQ